jgi:hypothetical protein
MGAGLMGRMGAASSGERGPVRKEEPCKIAACRSSSSDRSPAAKRLLLAEMPRRGRGPVVEAVLLGIVDASPGTLTKTGSLREKKRQFLPGSIRTILRPWISSSGLNLPANAGGVRSFPSKASPMSILTKPVPTAVTIPLTKSPLLGCTVRRGVRVWRGGAKSNDGDAEAGPSGPAAAASSALARRLLAFFLAEAAAVR